MKQIKDLLSKPLIRLLSTSIEIGMICAASFQIQSSRKNNSDNQQSTERYQYHRVQITYRLDNVTVEVFFFLIGEILNTRQLINFVFLSRNSCRNMFFFLYI